MKYCCTSPIIRSANSVEKMQVFCAWSSLRMSACTVPRTVRERLGADLRVGLGGDELVARDAEQPEARAVVARRGARPGSAAAAAPAKSAAIFARVASQPPLSRRCRSTRWSIAAFMKNARIIGAGPLIVIETEVVGAQRSKPE